MTVTDRRAEAAQTAPIRLVVFDFDDTLYDWIGHFVPALKAMIKVAAPLLGVSEPALREELKAVHEHYGNTEQPFALLETESAHRLFGSLSREEQRSALSPAFRAFDEVREATLHLYDDVVPTLARLQDAGIPVAGYSAAPSANLAKRIKLLKLAQYFSRIYASPFIGKPYPGAPADTAVEFDIVEIPHPKPDSMGIRRIARDFGVRPHEALFVGDSIASDIAPALVAGARATLLRRNTSSYEDWLPDLLKVSHRPAETRADSREVSDEALDRVPILTDLGGLWEHYRFVPPEEH